MLDLKYTMQHILARTLHKSNPKAALKAADGHIEAVDASVLLQSSIHLSLSLWHTLTLAQSTLDIITSPGNMPFAFFAQISPLRPPPSLLHPHLQRLPPQSTISRLSLRFPRETGIKPSSRSPPSSQPLFTLPVRGRRIWSSTRSERLQQRALTRAW